VPEDEPNLAEEGRVVEYIEDGVPKLGLLLQKLEEHERESKSLWIVGSQDARKFALSQAKFSYVWPEMPQLGLVDGITAQAVRGNAKQLAALAKEAEDLRATIAPERLQALWEEAQLTGDSPGTHSSSLCTLSLLLLLPHPHRRICEDSPRKTITPVQAAQFLFGSTGPLEVHAHHATLRHRSRCALLDLAFVFSHRPTRRTACCGRRGCTSSRETRPLSVGTARWQRSSRIHCRTE
jgi:hypothetical protein